MAGEIKQWDVNKVRSDRGFHIYRFGNLPIGLTASNPSQGQKFSHWYIRVTEIHQYRDKYYLGRGAGKGKGVGDFTLDYSPGRASSWKNLYLKEALAWLNEHKDAFFDFIFGGSQEP